MLAADPLNHLSRYLRARASAREEPLDGFYRELHRSPSQTGLDLAYDLLNAGLVDEAREPLAGLPGDTAPMAVSHHPCRA